MFLTFFTAYLQQNKLHFTFFMACYRLTTFRNFLFVQHCIKEFDRFFYRLSFRIMSNSLDSQKTKLLKTKTVDFSINNKQFSSNYFKKVKRLMLFLLKNSKDNNDIYLISVFSISPFQKIGQK